MTFSRAIDRSLRIPNAFHIDPVGLAFPVLVSPAGRNQIRFEAFLVGVFANDIADYIQASVEDLVAKRRLGYPYLEFEQAELRWDPAQEAFRR